MEKYNKFLRNITELIEKGLFTSRDLKKEIENALKFKVENIANRLNLVSREEFEVQKKRIEKLQKDLIKLKTQNKSGVGLGLSIANDIIRSHGGNISLEKSPLNGLRVKVSLPF